MVSVGWIVVIVEIDCEGWLDLFGGCVVCGIGEVDVVVVFEV